MALVAQVLSTADAPGYLVEDTAAGTRVWRASGPVDAPRELPQLEQAERDEAAMVTQLLARGWLRRTAGTQTRTGAAARPVLGAPPRRRRGSRPERAHASPPHPGPLVRARRRPYPAPRPRLALTPTTPGARRCPPHPPTRPPQVELSDAQHIALIDELFAHWHAKEPEAHHCFCGSDQDLVDAVAEIRAERERADDDEIGD